MELQEALSQISDIRRQMARAAVFRGYRSSAAAFSGLVAVGAAVAQSALIPDPVMNVKGYLGVWLVAAILGAAAAAVEMTVRCVRSKSTLQRELTMQAVEQFVPSLVAGALMTLALQIFTHDVTWLLPGLWAIVFSLGVFASRRVLPAAISIVGGYYLMAGLVCIALSGQIAPYSPWTMAVIFGVGQFIAAFILWWNLERHHGQP